YRYIRKTDEAPAAYMIEEAEAAWCGASMKCTPWRDSALARSPAGSTPQVSRLASRALVGNARWSGVCCATPPIAASPVSARPASLHGRGLCAHSVGGV